MPSLFLVYYGPGDRKVPLVTLTAQGTANFCLLIGQNKADPPFPPTPTDPMVQRKNQPRRPYPLTIASMRRRRWLSTRMTLSAKLGVCWVRKTKRFSSMAARVQSVSAVTVAARGA